MKEDIFYLLSILANNGGFTIKKYNIVAYKTGWQVATSGIETKDIEAAKQAIESYNGSCGVWFADGIYYVDECQRVDTKKKALEIGRMCAQISVFGWKRGNLAYC